MSNQTNESSVNHTSNLDLNGLGNLIKVASRKGKAHGQSSNDLFEFAKDNGFHSTHLLTSGNPAVKEYYAESDSWDARAHDVQLRKIQAMAIEGATSAAIAKHYIACDGSATKIKNVLTTAQYECFQAAWVNSSSPAKNECTNLRLRLETHERDQEKLRIQKLLETMTVDDLSEEDRLFIDPPRATDVVKTLATITKLVNKLKESEEPTGFTEGLTVGFFVRQFSEAKASILRDRPHLVHDLQIELGEKKK